MKKGYHKGQELTMSELRLLLEELAGQSLDALFSLQRVRIDQTGYRIQGVEQKVGFYLCPERFEFSLS